MPASVSILGQLNHWALSKEAGFGRGAAVSRVAEDESILIAARKPQGKEEAIASNRQAQFDISAGWNRNAAQQRSIEPNAIERELKALSPG